MVVYAPRGSATAEQPMSTRLLAPDELALSLGEALSTHNRFSQADRGLLSHFDAAGRFRRDADMPRALSQNEYRVFSVLAASSSFALLCPNLLMRRLA